MWLINFGSDICFALQDMLTMVSRPPLSSKQCPSLRSLFGLMVRCFDCLQQHEVNNWIEVEDICWQWYPNTKWLGWTASEKDKKGFHCPFIYFGFLLCNSFGLTVLHLRKARLSVMLVFSSWLTRYSPGRWGWQDLNNRVTQTINPKRLTLWLAERPNQLVLRLVTSQTWRVDN